MLARLAMRRRSLGSLALTLLGGAFAAALAVTPATSASAGAGGGWTPPASDPQAVELFKLGHDKKSNFVEPKSGQKWGRAHHFVDAPMKDVKAAVLDYGNYQQFIPKFQKSKLLKREASGAAQVYLQMPILKGAATLWAVIHFAPPVAEGKGEKIVGTFEKGNVEDLQAVWHIRPIDDKHTIVTLELYIVPKLTVPAGLLLSQVEDACGEGVIGVHERAETSAKLVAAKKP